MKQTMFLILLMAVALIGWTEQGLAKEKAAAWNHPEWCSAPESTFYDAQSKAIYVSCIVGEGDKKDGQDKTDQCKD